MTDTLATSKKVGAWEFSDAVVAEFDDHVRSSVAGYDTIQDVIARLSDWAAPDRAAILDVGCSTGTTLKAIQGRHPNRALALYGIDKSADMIRAASKKLGPGATLYADDVLAAEVKLPDSIDLTIAVLTLQFLPPDRRAGVLSELRRRSKETGVLVVAEKTIPADPRWALICAEASWEDKRIAGFSGDEIVAKAESLRGVLRPLREQDAILEPTLAGWGAPQVLWAVWNWRLVAYFAS